MRSQDVSPAATSHAIRKHYEAGIGDGDVIARLEARIAAIGEIETLERQIAALDHFHVRGRAATMDLAKLTEIGPGLKVLDAGSGLGGPSRYLVQQYGCKVTGVDLSPAFVAVASWLAARAGIGDSLRYQVGNIADLAFGDASFDLVWSEHVLMNLPDRTAAYRGFHRVLGTGGRFAFYEPYAIEGAKTPQYPMPWAGEASASHLLTRAETVAMLSDAGFDAVRWDDVAEAAAAAFISQPPPDPNELGLGFVMGPRFSEMAMNFARNITEGRLGLVMGVAIKTG